MDLDFCSLAVNRLAISGILNGDQPLTSEDGSVVVVFNGALYNSGKLGLKYGFDFRSMNDGEVIHFLYQKFGLAFADHLEGMYAICIADRERREMIVAADPIGIKPVYWHDEGERRRVASTVDAFPPRLRPDVRRVPPGVVWSTSGGARRIVHEYAAEGDLGELLSRSVAEQIPAEVPWGCMLSGGVDSSLIARFATDAAPEVHTFTCGTPNSTDLHAARDVAGVLGTVHHETLVDPDELPELVDRVVEATGSFERWTVMAGVGTYLTARSAHREGVKVLLSGEGADELFAGYDEFQDVPEPFLDGLLVHYQADLGVSECLRLDRCTMANSVEARVPFLNTRVIRHARSLPADDKIRRAGGTSTRKFALRHAAEAVLPQRIAQRTKEEFTNGSGLTDELRGLADKRYPPARLAELAEANPSFSLPDPLTGWFFERWRAIYGSTIGDAWTPMVERGLFRQPWNPYLPSARETGRYAG
ncbi:asparagine synthase-related protein [Streptomyces sp. TS71-3]|uniref:asparagine synthase-related protein n=1 Tax=Streptomyces sp. TS71-3 TaxID=2733862 RepID=UPI001BB32D4F|nr:asparagine synthase-related protein [Streptomyces sp. TS71-3]